MDWHWGNVGDRATTGWTVGSSQPWEKVIRKRLEEDDEGFGVWTCCFLMRLRHERAGLSLAGGSEKAGGGVEGTWGLYPLLLFFEFPSSPGQVGPYAGVCDLVTSGSLPTSPVQDVGNTHLSA